MAIVVFTLLLVGAYYAFFTNVPTGGAGPSAIELEPLFLVGGVLGVFVGVGIGLLVRRVRIERRRAARWRAVARRLWRRRAMLGGGAYRSKLGT
ncbi:MAG TPA: hypothetical protein VJ891_05185 [Casimicrobiaceae bacterium]|nr:hypothetical protein [Casimicrobiaceae bacterium]